MAMRNAGHAALTLRRASAQPCHLCGGTGLVDEDKLGWIQVELLLKPSFAGGGYIGALLLGRVLRLYGMARLFSPGVW